MGTIFSNRALYVFLLALVAFILLALTTFSTPVISSLYFLHSTQANGVKFGIWGWCLDQENICSTPPKLGYIWAPEIPTSITAALVFYPISVILVFLTLVSLLPVICARSARSDKIFSIFAWSSFSSSLFAWLFTIGIFGAAKARNEKRGFTVTFGNLTWMSLVAVLLLLAVALSPLILPPPPKPRPNAHLGSRSLRQRWSQWSRSRDPDLERQMRTKIGIPPASK